MKALKVSNAERELVEEDEEVTQEDIDLVWEEFQDTLVKLFEKTPKRFSGLGGEAGGKLDISKGFFEM